MIRIFVGFLTVTRTVPSAGTRSPSRRGWRASRFTPAGTKRALVASVPAGQGIHVRIPDMDPLSLKMTFRIARVSGGRPGHAFRYPDSPEVTA